MPGRLFYTGCYPAHNSGEPALESPAQFTAGGVVIGSTISVRCASRGKKNGCYRAHNLDFFSAGGRLLSTAQFARWVKFGYCYRQHISEFRLLSKRVRAGLLSSAPFRQSGCYPAHNSQKSVFLRRVLLWVVSLRTVCPAGAGVVIDGTIQGFFSTGCYSAHISPRQDFSIRPVGMLRTFLTFPFFAPGVVILDTF